MQNKMMLNILGAQHLNVIAEDTEMKRKLK